MNRTMIGTVWVCTDCLYAAEGLTEGIDTEATPWALLAPGEDVTSGMVSAEHDTPCGSFDGPDGPFLGGECECEQREFSWASCQGCGSTLGGSRHAYTVWSE